MRRSEWIAAGYFAYLLLPVWLTAPRTSRWRLTAAALGLSGGVLALGSMPLAGPWPVVRAWAPGAYLLAGYWLPGRLFRAPDERLEGWLLRMDAYWLGPRVVDGSLRPPPLVSASLELAYLLCYPLVPIAFALVYFSEGEDVSMAVRADRFWAVVLLAVFVCYGLLPWLPTRPPRALVPGASASRSPLRRLNLLVLNRASIQVNTFPSGHVAAALAAALAVAEVLPVAGLGVAVMAAAIAVAAVVGRYHYSADVLLGALVALAAFLVAR